MSLTNVLLTIICILLLCIALSMNRIDITEYAEADSIQDVNIHSVGGKRVFNSIPTN